MRIDLSLAQLRVLEAASAGTLHRGPHDVDRHHTASTLGIWRINGGRAVMLTANILVDRGLITEGTPLADGRIPAVVTDRGLAVLDELASREPQPTTPKDHR